jgi:dihydroxyacetone kinase-like predicted kinase
MQVFLSYASSDEAFAKDLSSELTKRGLSVWLDEENILPGDNLHQRIAEALAKSNAMVVLISPDSMNSNFVRSEIEYALGNPKYEGRLFPVEVRPAKEVPWILDRLQRFNASQGAKKISQSIANALSQVA